MRGSAIHRIGYERWLRNIAVALGNARTTPEVLAALEARRAEPSALVREHVLWALARHAEQAARQRVAAALTGRLSIKRARPKRAAASTINFEPGAGEARSSACRIAK